jgi:hypothetical protein
MRLQFTNRGMRDGIIAVLHNIYYYTGRWGLSVASFTGARTEYWQELPQRLRAVQNQPEQLEALIAELEALAKGASDRTAKRQALVKQDGFQQKEVVVNEQLLMVLAAFPAHLLAEGLRRLTGHELIPTPARLVDRHLGSGEQLIEPDFLVMADHHLLMGEMKIKAAGEISDTKYDPNQLCNYLSLAIKCRTEQSEGLPRQFSHLVLLPSIDHRWFVRGQEWVLELQTGPDRQMKIDAAACFALAENKKKQRYVTSAAALSSLLADIPVYCRTFKELAQAFGEAASGYPLEGHWIRLSGELEALASLAEAGVRQ